ncbi:MAG: hypothetical protein AVDCRST_MAG53-2116 [uncultured Solirubrobacteraceae bacterium]|uniref:Uncharacterized protein n=1 Tax=uncultured Solirubrobacteraceae bacterium TaxID=1162706 RepID=A0A6J4SRL9_9ACTN|nr:MAG: hypothetical protein AVDCRST_MAG53-2116 [uncultured Solirubrobacteraceae bacterium]
MRNRHLHAALTAFAEEAAWQLASDVAEGHELGFEVEQARPPSGGRTRKQRQSGAFYCYRPLTAEFIDARGSVVAQLPSYLPAVHALAQTGGLDAYLDAQVAHGGIPMAPRERAELALRAFLGRVFVDSNDFVLEGGRLEAAYSELEAVVTEGRAETVVVAPVLGLELASAEVAMGDGLVLIRGEVLEDAPADAVWPRGTGLPGRAAVLAVLRFETAAGEPAPLEPAGKKLRRLLTALRLFDEAPVCVGPSAWTRTAGGPWASLALGLDGSPPGPDTAVCLITAPEEDELRAFCNLVSRRLPRGGELAWALRRFELGCARPRPAEALTDHLLALRALLASDPEQPGLLVARVAALCSEPAERTAHAARLEHTAGLERSLVAGVGLPDAEMLADLVDELAGDCRAILRDVLCGHLDPDLRRTADRLLAPQPTGEEPALR